MGGADGGGAIGASGEVVVRALRLLCLISTPKRPLDDVRMHPKSGYSLRCIRKGGFSLCGPEASVLAHLQPAYEATLREQPREPDRK